MIFRKSKFNRFFIAVPAALCLCGIVRADEMVNGVEQTVNSTHNSYDAVGNEVVDPDTPSPGSTTYTYDAQTRTVYNTDQPPANQTTYDYDAMDNDVATIPPSGPTTYTYDAQDRVTKNTDPTYAPSADTASNDTISPDSDPYGGKTTYAYDGAGNDTVTQTDPNGNTTTYTYDAQDRSIQSIDGMDPTGNTTTYSYDALDRTIQDTDSLTIGGTNGYDTTDMGTIDLNGDGTSYLYDAQGSLDFSGSGDTVDFSVTLFDVNTHASTLLFKYDGPTPGSLLNYNVGPSGPLSGTDDYQYIYSLELSGPFAAGVSTNLSFALTAVPLPAAAPMGAVLLGLVAVVSRRRTWFRSPRLR